MAVSDIIAALIPNKAEKPKDPLEGYTQIYFHCWLCEGRNDFAYKNSSNKREFTIECSRCGVDNKVSLN
jgi:hypothetical protein